MCGRIPIVVEMLAFGKETNQPDAYFVIRRAIPSRLKTTCKRRADELTGTAPSVRLCDASPAAARACTSIST